MGNNPSQPLDYSYGAGYDPSSYQPEYEHSTVSGTILPYRRSRMNRAGAGSYAPSQMPYASGYGYDSYRTVSRAGYIPAGYVYGGGYPAASYQVAMPQPQQYVTAQMQPYQPTFQMPQVGVQMSQAGMQMPQAGVQMPQAGYQMPQAGYQMLQAGYQMPQAGVQMPQAGVQMPQAGVQMPQAGYQMPQAGVQMPQAGVQMPQAGAQMFQAGVQMPQPGVQMTQAGMQMPQPGVQMPQAGVQMPQAGVQMPQAGVQMPQPGVQMPQAGVQMPQAGVQMPQSGTQMPQAGVPMPQPSVQAGMPQVGVQMPQPYGQDNYPVIPGQQPGNMRMPSPSPQFAPVVPQSTRMGVVPPPPVLNSFSPNPVGYPPGFIPDTGRSASMTMPEPQVQMQMPEPQTQMPGPQTQMPGPQMQMPGPQMQMPQAQVQMPQGPTQMGPNIQMPQPQVPPVIPGQASQAYMQMPQPQPAQPQYMQTSMPQPQLMQTSMPQPQLMQSQPPFMPGMGLPPPGVPSGVQAAVDAERTSRNPLPEPPHDIWSEKTPYRRLLRDLPKTTEILTRSNTLIGPVTAQPVRRSGTLGRRLGSLFRRRRAGSDSGIFVAPDPQLPVPGLSIQMPQVPPTPDGGQAPVIPPVSMAGPSMPQPTPVIPPVSMHGRSTPQPAHPPQGSPSTIRFDHTGPYAGFLNHSPHRVLYQNKTYPSALHLFEALKFLGHRPDIADRIRACTDVRDVYPLSAQYHDLVRRDWGEVLLKMAEEVIYHKFKQHPDLRNRLMNTGIANLIYADLNDTYWGDGPLGQGLNELGKALMRVRNRLQDEGYGT